MILNFKLINLNKSVKLYYMFGDVNNIDKNNSLILKIKKNLDL